MRNIYFSDHDAFKCKLYLNISEDGIDFSINKSTQEWTVMLLYNSEV